MSNSQTIDSIKNILTGETPIPDEITNQLIFIAIQENYQESQKIRHEVVVFGQELKEQRKTINDIDTTQQLQGNELIELNNDLKRLEKISGRWDKILAVAAVLGSSLSGLIGINK